MKYRLYLRLYTKADADAELASELTWGKAAAIALHELKSLGEG